MGDDITAGVGDIARASRDITRLVCDITPPRGDITRSRGEIAVGGEVAVQGVRRCRILTGQNDRVRRYGGVAVHDASRHAAMRTAWRPPDARSGFLSSSNLIPRLESDTMET